MNKLKILHRAVCLRLKKVQGNVFILKYVYICVSFSSVSHDKKFRKLPYGLGFPEHFAINNNLLEHNFIEDLPSSVFHHILTLFTWMFKTFSIFCNY